MLGGCKKRSHWEGAVAGKPQLGPKQRETQVLHQLGENGSEPSFLRRSRTVRYLLGRSAAVSRAWALCYSCSKESTAARQGLDSPSGVPVASSRPAPRLERRPVAGGAGSQQSAGPARPGLKCGAGPSQLPSNPHSRVTAGPDPRGFPSSSPLLRPLK